MAKNTKQTIEQPIQATEISIADMTLSAIKEQIALYQSAIDKKKASVLTDAVKAAKKAYLSLSAQGIAMSADIFVGSLQELTDSERETLKNELEGGLKPSSFEEYTLLDAIREELIGVVKTCNYKKSGKTSTGSPRKVKLSNYMCVCPICNEQIGNPKGHTQKHLIVNQVRLHMLNKHEISKERFNTEYRAVINNTTIATEAVTEEMR